MHFFKPNKRIMLLWLASVVVWSLGLLTSSIPIFPCQTFVFDSPQGYASDMCPLVQDDHLLIQTNTTDFNAIPTIWTWPVLFLVLLVFPYLDSVIIDQRITIIQQRLKK